MASASSSARASSGALKASGYLAEVVAVAAVAALSVGAPDGQAITAVNATSGAPFATVSAPQAIAQAASVVVASGAPVALGISPATALADAGPSLAVASAALASVSIIAPAASADIDAVTVAAVRALPRDWRVRDLRRVARLDAKHVPERVALYFDYTGELGGEAVAALLSLVVTVEHGADATPEAILSGTPAQDAGGVLAFVAGGMAGVDYRLDCVVRTDTGRELLRRAMLPVRA